MPAENLNQRLSAVRFDRASEKELRVILAALIDGVRAITVKLDAEAGGGVTGFDTNYTAAFDALITKS